MTSILTAGLSCLTSLVTNHPLSLTKFVQRFHHSLGEIWISFNKDDFPVVEVSRVEEDCWVSSIFDLPVVVVVLEGKNIGKLITVRRISVSILPPEQQGKIRQLRNDFSKVLSTNTNQLSFTVADMITCPFHKMLHISMNIASNVKSSTNICKFGTWARQKYPTLLDSTNISTH